MESIEQLLKTLADKNRLRILALLSKKDYCVCELAHVLKITQPSVSKHLKKLKALELIDSRQDGLWTNYFLCPLKDNGKQKIINLIIESLNKLQQVQKDEKVAKKVSREDICC